MIVDRNQQPEVAQFEARHNGFRRGIELLYIMLNLLNNLQCG